MSLGPIDGCEKVIHAPHVRRCRSPSHVWIDVLRRGLHEHSVCTTICADFISGGSEVVVELKCRVEVGVVFRGVAFRELRVGRSQWPLPQWRHADLQGSTHC